MVLAEVLKRTSDKAGNLAGFSDQHYARRVAFDQVCDGVKTIK